MKFTVSSADLLEHLQNISRVLSSKNNALPILDNYLIKVEGSTVEITASDKECSAITRLPIADVEGSGAITARAALINNLLKEFPEQPLTFDINNDNLSIIIESANGQYKLIGENADQYLELPKPAADAKTIKVQVDTLIECLNKASFAVSTDTNVPILTCVFFDITTDHMAVVGTEGHRLVRIRCNNVKGDTDCHFVMGRKITQLLKGVLMKEDPEEEIEITFDNSNIFIKLSDQTFISSQISGNYPKYESVIPKQNELEAIIGRDDLLKVLRRVSVFQDSSNNIIKLAFNENKVVVSAQDINYSISAEEHITCQYSGQPLVLGFKSNLMIEMLNNLNSPEVKINIKDSQGGVLMFPMGNEDATEDIDILMLLMPVLV